MQTNNWCEIVTITKQYVKPSNGNEKKMCSAHLKMLSSYIYYVWIGFGIR